MNAEQERAESAETAAVLAGLPGGRALLAWFGGPPNFGDAEVIGLALDRTGASTLRIRATHIDRERGSHDFEGAVVTFTLTEMIEVALKGFSHQNVIGGLILRRAPDRPVHPSLVGVGLASGEHEIELRPCFGAFGTIHATIASVAFEPVQRS